jgi:hypothetical protein
VKPLQEIVNKYKWVHTSIGILGNTCFFIGSIFFLFESLKNAGVWLFIFGSAGMLIGSVGSAFVMEARNNHNKRR